MNSSVQTTKKLKLVMPLGGKMLSQKVQRGKLFSAELRSTTNQSSQALSWLAQPLLTTDAALSPRSKPQGSETTDLLKLTKNSETSFLKKLHLESVQTPKKQNLVVRVPGMMTKTDSMGSASTKSSVVLLSSRNLDFSKTTKF